MQVLNTLRGTRFAEDNIIRMGAGKIFSKSHFGDWGLFL